MIKKNLIVFAYFSLMLIYIAYKIIAFFILESQITQDNVKPKIKLSQIITISEERVRYSNSFYIKKDFIGFNAFIDEKYYITVTKLGKVTKNYKIIKTDERPNNSTNINLIHTTDDEDENTRYIYLHKYPFYITKIYYYADNLVLNINQSKFYEIETIFNFFNISFDEENRQDFGYAGSKNKKSISPFQVK